MHCHSWLTADVKKDDPTIPLTLHQFSQIQILEKLKYKIMLVNRVRSVAPETPHGVQQGQPVSKSSLVLVFIAVTRYHTTKAT